MRNRAFLALVRLGTSSLYTVTLGISCADTTSAATNTAAALYAPGTETPAAAGAGALDAGQAATCSAGFAACVLRAPTARGVSQCLERFSDCDALFGDEVDGGAQSACSLQFSACVLAAPVAPGECLAAFQRCDAAPPTPAVPDTCGDGTVAPDEECDPAAPGWRDYCSPSCKRTAYEACSTHEECGEPNANCAAFSSEPESQLCANFCEDAGACPVLPGFESVCDFAWCAVTCHDGKCPNAMRCQPDFVLLNRQGEAVGKIDVCVAAPQVHKP